MKIKARPWTPQDLLDDLQGIIDEESDNYLNTRRTTLEMALAYLKEYSAKDTNVPDKNVGKWIPVTEVVPSFPERVLVFLKPEPYAYTQIDTDRIRRGKWVRWNGCVTHWMPLPKPPKEVDHDSV